MAHELDKTVSEGKAPESSEPKKYEAGTPRTDADAAKADAHKPKEM